MHAWETPNRNSKPECNTAHLVRNLSNMPNALQPNPQLNFLSRHPMWRHHMHHHLPGKAIPSVQAKLSNNKLLQVCCRKNYKSETKWIQPTTFHEPQHDVKIYYSCGNNSMFCMHAKQITPSLMSQSIPQSSHKHQHVQHLTCLCLLATRSNARPSDSFQFIPKQCHKHNHKKSLWISHFCSLAGPLAHAHKQTCFCLNFFPSFGTAEAEQLDTQCTCIIINNEALSSNVCLISFSKHTGRWPGEWGPNIGQPRLASSQTLDRIWKHAVVCSKATFIFDETKIKHVLSSTVFMLTFSLQCTQMT